jgi:hypothetical protein
MVHHKLPDKIANPGPLLSVMRTCRQAMITACSQVKPRGPNLSRAHYGRRCNRCPGVAVDGPE